MNPINGVKIFWCHSCRRQIMLNSDAAEIRCSNCLSELVEEVENFDQHPSRFVAQGLQPSHLVFPQAPVRVFQIFTSTFFRGHSGAPPATQNEFNGLEAVSSVDGDCSICQEELRENCRKMRCGHVYHLECLAPWLRIHNTCPVCRLPIS